MYFEIKKYIEEQTCSIFPQLTCIIDEIESSDQLLNVLLVSNSEKTIKITIHIFLRPNGMFRCVTNVEVKICDSKKDHYSKLGYQRLNFDICDLVSILGISFDPHLLWKDFKCINELKEMLNALFIHVKEVLMFDTVKCIFDENFWIDVPIDFSPYK